MPRRVPKIAAVDVFPVGLPYRQTLRLSSGVAGSPDALAPHVYVRVTTEDGHAGWGEARPSHRWSYETEATVVDTLRRHLAPAVVGRAVSDIVALPAVFDAEIAGAPGGGQPVARSALDMAVRDAWAHWLDAPMWALEGLPMAPRVAFAGLVSAPEPEEAAAAVRAALSEGFPGVKVKLSGRLDLDLRKIEAVNDTAPQGADVWFDANQAYTAADAHVIGAAVGRRPGAVLEQPVAAWDVAALESLVSRRDVAIAVDEGGWDAREVAQLARRGAMDLYVAKVCKAGGYGRAREAAATAAAHGIGLLVSGLTESALGLAASALLTAVIGCRRPADLNGPQFIASNPGADQLDLTPSHVTLNDRPGWGVTPPVAEGIALA